MRALVTGAGGFAGKYLCRHLLEQGDEVHGTYCSAHEKEALEAGVLPHPLDVADAAGCELAVRETRPEAIYHLAAVSFVPDAERDFAHALSVNVGGTFNLARALAASSGPRCFLLVSSGEVYGRVAPHELPIGESQELRPATSYALTKVLAENVLLRFKEVEDMRSAIVRPMNHLGPGQSDRFMASTFAKQLAEISLGQAEPVVRVGDLAPRRDFSDVRDVVRGYRLAARNGRGVYNLGSGASTSVREILDELIAISGMSVRIEQDPARMRGGAPVPEMRLSVERARADLGWKHSIPLKATLRDVFMYWRDTLQRR